MGPIYHDFCIKDGLETKGGNFMKVEREEEERSLKLLNFSN